MDSFKVIDIEVLDEYEYDKSIENVKLVGISDYSIY